MILSILILALICLLMLSAIFSASETSLFSLSSFTVKTYKDSYDKRSRLIAKLLSNPRQLLVTILMLNIFSNILIQNTVSSLFGNFSTWLLKVGVPLLLTLFFGEIIPKAISLPNNRYVAKKLAPFISFSQKLLTPIRIVLTKVTSYISRVMFFFLKKENPISIDELKHILKESKEKGVIDVDETQLAKGYLKLHDSIVKEHMRPREQIHFYDINDDLSKLIELFSNKRISRVPVCQNDLENTIGMISVRRFFFYQSHIKNSEDLKKYLKKPYYIPDSTKSWTLLQKLREIKESIAMVVDEYGSITGLVTQEDLTESVIGEIIDTRDVKSLFTTASEDVIIASGRMEIDEIERIFNVELPRKSSSVTLGGWLTDQMGDIPQVGTKYREKELVFYVLASDPNRIRRVYIRKLKTKEKKI